MLRNRFSVCWNGAVRRGSKNIIEIKNVEIVSENQEKSKEVKTSFSKTEIQRKVSKFFTKLKIRFLRNWNSVFQIHFL